MHPNAAYAKIIADVAASEARVLARLDQVEAKLDTLIGGSAAHPPATHDPLEPDDMRSFLRTLGVKDDGEAEFPRRKRDGDEPGDLALAASAPKGPRPRKTATA